MPDDLKVKIYQGLCEEWLNMVKANRMEGNVQNEYDIVCGPVANDNTMRTIALRVSILWIWL